MTIKEFEIMTDIYPSWTLWEEINRTYNESELDKQIWCAAYKANEGGLAERIQSACDVRLGKSEAKLLQMLRDAQSALREMTEERDRLQLALDRELDWHPAEDIGTNMIEREYQILADDTPPMSEKEAMYRIHNMCGFDMEHIRIVEHVHTYEVNKHHKLRVKDTYSRRPVWSASDWNYIRFNVCGHQWEIVNGELMPYCE